MVPLTLNAIRDLTSKERIAEPDKHCKALQNWIRHRKDLRAKENKRVLRHNQQSFNWSAGYQSSFATDACTELYLQ